MVGLRRRTLRARRLRQAERTFGWRQRPNLNNIFPKLLQLGGRPMTKTTRRNLVQGAAAITVATALAGRASAQGAPLKLGILTPLTGAGGADGPRMLKAMQGVIEEANKAGGVLGRKIETV